MPQSGFLVTALVAACAGETVVITTTAAPTTTQSLTRLQAVVPAEPFVPAGSVEGVDHLFVAAAVSVDDVTHAYIVGFGPDGHWVIEMTWSGVGS